MLVSLLSGASILRPRSAGVKRPARPWRLPADTRRIRSQRPMTHARYTRPAHSAPGSAHTEEPMAYFIEDHALSTRSTLRSDARGCPTSTSSGAALADLEQALESMLSYFGDPLA